VLRTEAARPVPEVAPANGACVAIIAHDAFTEILSTHAVYADAGNAAPVAVRSVQVHLAARTVRLVLVLGALVAVVARVLYADAGYTDAGKTIQVASEYVDHGSVVADPVHARIVGACVLVAAVLVAPTLRRFTASH
jgi:hypothetical protein